MIALAIGVVHVVLFSMCGERGIYNAYRTGWGQLGGQVLGHEGSCPFPTLPPLFLATPMYS